MAIAGTKSDRPQGNECLKDLRPRARTFTRPAEPGRIGSVGSRAMLVTDLHHFLDLPDDIPGPARRLAAYLSNIVRAATAGDAGTAWMTTLPCRCRPARRPCRGR